MIMENVKAEQIQHCAERISSMYDPEMTEEALHVEEGLKLYRLGNVNITNAKNGFVLARVQDYEAYQVRFDFEFIENSVCTCSDDVCVHVLAVFFDLYSHFQSVTRFISNWKNEEEAKSSEQNPVSKTPKFKLEASLKKWLIYFEEEFNTYMEKEKKNRSFYYALRQRDFDFGDFYTRFYRKIIEEEAEDYFLQKLYEVAAGLQTFMYMMRIVEERDMKVTHGSFAYSKVKELTVVVSEQIEQFGEMKGHNEYEDILKEFVLFSDKFLFSSDLFLYDRLLLVRQCWKYLFLKDDWRKKYYKHLVKSKHPLYEHEMMKAHFWFLRDEDKKAMIVLKRLETNPLMDLMLWLDWIVADKNSERLQLWTKYGMEQLKRFVVSSVSESAKREMTKILFHYLQKYVDWTGENKVYVSALKSLLPYTFYEMNFYLLKQEDYKTWAELHLLFGFQPEMFDRELLKEIEKTAPEAMLPLYHHAAEKEINEKNRKAYRKACRYLKKLRTLYRKQKRMDEWDVFIVSIADKYKRLRAFQEELRKGKKGQLIND